MTPIDGALARRFDFGDTAPAAPGVHGGRAGLRLALGGAMLRGPQKYKVLEHRRRQAQIRARRLLDLVDLIERANAEE